MTEEYRFLPSQGETQTATPTDLKEATQIDIGGILDVGLQDLDVDLRVPDEDLQGQDDPILTQTEVPAEKIKRGFLSLASKRQ